MTYFILYLTLLLITVIEYNSTQKNTRKILFIISSGILLIFCSLRYDVGFDYDNYRYIYSSLPNSFSVDIDLKHLHGEFLFLCFFILLKWLGFSYPLASALIIFIINIIFIIFISKYSPYKCFSILILYSWYFVYIFSTLRQGLAISLFLIFAFPLLERKEYIKYFVIIFLISLVHYSLLIAFLAPIGLWLLKRVDNYIIIIIVALFIGLTPNPILSFVTNNILGGKGSVYLDNNINYFALFNRFLAFALIFLSTNYLVKKNEYNKYSSMLLLYILGFLLYLITAQSDLVASRLASNYKIFDIILLPLILKRLPNKFYPIFICFMSIYLGFVFMNLISGMATINNFSDYWEYPYKMIFSGEYYFNEN